VTCSPTSQLTKLPREGAHHSGDELGGTVAVNGVGACAAIC
jgi:hypothetical protein